MVFRKPRLKTEIMWLPLLMTSLVAVDSAQQCKSTYTVLGRYLKDHVISSENVKNIGMCYIQCSKDQRCKSINFHFGDLLCELNDADRHTHPWDYVLKKDHLYSDYPVKVIFKEFYMTPLWLEAHASYIDSNRNTTTNQMTFNAGSISDAALVKVPLVAAGVLADGTPLTVEITVANDVNIGQHLPNADSDIRYGVSDGTNFIGFEVPDKKNYREWAPYYGVEAQSGATLSTIKYFDRFTIVPSAIASFYPDQFVFTIKLDKQWGSCFTAHGGGFIKTAKFTKQLLVSQGLTLEVYKSQPIERVGIKYIKITIIKTDG
ncbi:uncharacterized protein LOC144662229 [Oculina patagonica]